MKAKYTLLKNKATGERSVVNNRTGERITEKDSPAEYKRLRRLAIGNRKRAKLDQVMRDSGPTKCRGPVSGKAYWE
jgi:hypothetical protein